MDTEPAANVVYSNSNNLFNKYFRFIAIFILLIIIALVAFYFGQRLGSESKQVNQNPSSSTSVVSASRNPVFQNQSAVVNGKIIKFENGKYIIENSEGESSSFNIAPKIVIYKQTPGLKHTNITSNKNDIELNKLAVITLSVIDGEYKISSISYLSPPSPPPKNE